MSNNNDTTKTKQKRGAFPRVSLKSVLELVDAINTIGHGEPVRRREAFENIGRSPESSASYALITAANAGYKLIKGSKNSSHLELTEAGQTLAEAKDKARRTAAVTLLMENTFFDSVVEKFGDRPIPIDSVAVDFLKREEQLNEKDAEGCWSIIKENLMDFSLIEESSGKQIIIPKDVLISSIDSSIPSSQKSDDTQLKNDSKPEMRDSELKSEKQPVTGKQSRHQVSNPQIAFNIQVVLPENADPDTYDSIFRSISKHLLYSQDTSSDDNQD